MGKYLLEVGTSQWRLLAMPPSSLLLRPSGCCASFWVIINGHVTYVAPPLDHVDNIM